MNRNQMKILAIVSMTVDHIAPAFLPEASVFYYVMRLFGRLAAPIIIFLLTEGYRHTRSKKKYFRRLTLFAAISQPVYFLFVVGRPPINALEYLTCWNVMLSLAIGLLIMMLFYSSIRSCTSISLLGCLISLSHICDWSYLIPSWTIIFFCFYKRDTRKMIVLFVLASVTLQTLVYCKQFDRFASVSFQFGTLSALIPIILYNGERGNFRHQNLNRWFFYIYYPAHMVIIYLLRFEK